ncbi:MAG: octanoyl-[GcvH]:protein N-octanoyltransferase [Solirubrobacteraceae bacterium]|jgi:lipoate-protein ligase A|nr:octanoyl-[GcvH]:protein N-octanoyltransferase [Solirubrobacteraceae bacterium]
MRLLRASFPDRPAVDAAVGEALLRGALPGPVLRIARPGPTVGFGRLDAIRPGFADAARAARAHGFEPVLRTPGGHAAAYHHGSLLVELVAPGEDPVSGMRERFADFSSTLATALQALGVDARVGPVDGEYCPGDYSVNAGGQVKLAGVAQRLVRRAWMVGAELVVEDGAPVRAVLTDVYAALGLELDPATAAAVEDVAPQVTVDDVERALLGAFPIGARLALDDGLVAAAEALAPRHSVAS